MFRNICFSGRRYKQLDNTTALETSTLPIVFHQIKLGFQQRRGWFVGTIAPRAERKFLLF
jgi:hypothetical protein